MKKLSLPLLLSPLLFFFTACVSNEKVSMGGAAGWIAGGAKLSSEPAPMKPDPALLEFEEDGGPVELKIITDKREYKTPTTSKPSSRPAPDPLERGRDYRIKRLFH